MVFTLRGATAMLSVPWLLVGIGGRIDAILGLRHDHVFVGHPRQSIACRGSASLAPGSASAGSLTAAMSTGSSDVVTSFSWAELVPAPSVPLTAS